ncbi:MAG: ion transporter [Ruminococcaceae bacterium]|jgi:voltage-gated potassium channel|nr:ion transporter [Oscillospiraceae bacterium]
MKHNSVKRRIFDIIQIGNQEDLPSRAFDIFLVAVILLNIAAMFLETFDSLAAWRGLFETVETVTVAVFCVEYGLRIWTAEYLFPGESRGRAVWRFLRSYDGIIDLLTILPFFFLSGFVVFRMLRVVRIFHLFRINTQYDSFNVIKSVLYEKRNQIASSVFIILILMLASSLFMYSAEHEAQPEAFRNALSGIWWSVSTMLTVGYGDIYPVTVMGRAMAIIISFLGVGVVAIPTGIISAGFVEQYTKMQQETPQLARELTAITITMDSAWIGKSVEEIEKEYGVDIVLVRRRGKVSPPKQHYAVQQGDEVAYL